MNTEIIGEVIENSDKIVETVKEVSNKIKPKKERRYSKTAMATSKKLLWFTGGLCIFITLYACFAISMNIVFNMMNPDSYVSFNFEPLIYLIPPPFGAFATCCGFYLNMAKSDHKKDGISYAKMMYELNSQNEDSEEDVDYMTQNESSVIDNTNEG